MAMTRKEIVKKYTEKKYEEAPLVDCACGCGKKTKSVNKHGRKKLYADGCRPRKYDDPKQYQREFLKRHKNELRRKKASFRKQRKVELIRYKGGVCENKCGQEYNGKNAAIFEFHHLRDKRFGISAGLADYSMDTLKVEVDKCQLLCACCHAMKHSEEY